MHQVYGQHATQDSHKDTITLKINHPKLNSVSYQVPVYLNCGQAIAHVSQRTLLALFSNFYIEFQNKPVHPKKLLKDLLPPNSRQLELDVAFQYYNYASAVHHLQQVAKVIKQPHKLAILLRAGKTEEGPSTVQTEQLTNEVVPSSFRINKVRIQDIIAPQYCSALWNNKAQEQPQFVQFIGVSGFTPSSQAELGGDLLYLHAKILQNVDLHITACPLGFYLNQCKVNLYNPSPVPGRPTYASLLDLLCACSDKFSHAYTKLQDLSQSSLIDRLVVREQTIIRTSKKTQEQWLDEHQPQHQWNVRKQGTFQQIDRPTTSTQDWNDLFLSVERKAEHLRNVLKIEDATWERKELQKIYSKFQEAAIDGAKKIVEGRIQAMNHSDQKKKHIYVYNRIFFSITQDTILNHSLDKGEQMIPTGSSSNTDLIQLSQLITNRPNNLHLLHTVLVFYRGYRIIAQTMIPGLLSSQLCSLTQYGSVDDNKNINNNPQFHQTLLDYCLKMHLDQKIQAYDNNDRLVPIAISPEIKGIRSSNGEKYLCDLQRLSPRDLNYEGLDHQGCVLRQELIKLYIKDKGKEELLPINPNIATSIRFRASQKTQKQEKQLKMMAAYLEDQALSNLAMTLRSKSGGNDLTNSEGLSKVFHSHGVNMRYLGKLYRHKLLTESVEVKVCLLRNVLVRSLKHLFRKALRESNPLHLSATIAHLLNCIFAKKHQLQQLQKIQEIEERQEMVEPKRKKKKKHKQQEHKLNNNEEKIIKIENSRLQTIRPHEFWTQICMIAKARFDHTFESTLQAFQKTGLFRMVYQKYATLKDLCLSIGLVLEKRNYDFSASGLQESLPFNSRNILGFRARTKLPLSGVCPSIARAVAAADKLFDLSHFTDALKSYQEACRLIRQQEQKAELSHCLGQISRIQYMLGRVQQAFNIEAGNLSLIYRTYRQDSFEAIRCYSRLGLYCMSLGASETALWLLGRGLNLMLVCFGQAYPDVLINIANIARVYQQNRQSSQAINCYLKAIEMLSQVHCSKSNINASFCYSSLASISYETGQYRKSFQYQNQAANILMKALPPEDPRNLDAQKILKVYRDLHFSQPRPHNDRRK